GYRRRLSPEGVDMVGADAAGLFYATQTLLQVLALRPKPAGRIADIEALEITDWPHYRVRELMLDVGRAPFSVPLLRRAVRIMARLKLNTLHLHLHDDPLNGLRYDKLPLGSENPTAMTIDDLRCLVAYARQWHVEIIPELEAWGHAGSIVYHYPNLIGGPGMWGGFSFAIGEELYDLLEKMLDEVVPVLEPNCTVHLGLDEANWYTLPSVPADRKNDYSPERHVARLHEILQRVGKRHNRKPRLRIWADHGGRPVPADIAPDVIVEPWMYTECREANIREKVAKYGGAGKPPFMMGGGMSSMHLSGTFGATALWCQAAMDMPNCEGIDICMWENNNLAGQLMGVFGGADYAWTPLTPAIGEKDNLFRERIQGDVLIRMKKWQSAFPDADDGAIRLDTGPEVHAGRYIEGPLAGHPVAPTAAMKEPPPIDAATD
ncbi:MAG: family 20 glycosylhydrolase, partial [Phycisphaerae bacterium]|nr:family 20 glycosylhydrolase [Phycisphaerae bacterium]